MFWKTTKKEPKFNVGEIFYTYYTIETIMAKAEAASEESNINTQLNIATISIITEIKIDEKNITYTVKEYLKNNTGIDERTNNLTEDQLKTYNQTEAGALASLLSLYSVFFAEITKRINKEKLTEVLGGKK